MEENRDRDAWDDGMHSARMLGCVLMMGASVVLALLLAFVVVPLVSGLVAWLSN